jgi:hypothetical protein
VWISEKSSTSASGRRSAAREHGAEVVRVRVALGADQAEDAHPRAEDAHRLHVQRQDAHHFFAIAGNENAKRLAAAVELPPVELPDPRIEHARGICDGVQAVPVGRERGELGLAREQPHRQRSRRGDAAVGGRGPQRYRRIRELLVHRAIMVGRRRAARNAPGGLHLSYRRRAAGR